MVARACNPGYSGGWGRRIASTQEVEIVVSQDRAPALQPGQQEQKNSVSKQKKNQKILSAWNTPQKKEKRRFSYITKETVEHCWLTRMPKALRSFTCHTMKIKDKKMRNSSKNEEIKSRNIPFQQNSAGKGDSSSFWSPLEVLQYTWEEIKEREEHIEITCFVKTSDFNLRATAIFFILGVLLSDSQASRSSWRSSWSTHRPPTLEALMITHDGQKSPPLSWKPVSPL